MYILIMLKYEGYKTIHVRCKSKTKNTEKKHKSWLFHSLHLRSIVNPLFFLGRGKKTTNNPVFKKRIPQQEFLAARWIKAGDGISQLELQQVHLRGGCRPCLFHTRKAGRFPRKQNRVSWKQWAQTVVFQGFVGDENFPTQLYRDS